MLDQLFKLVQEEAQKDIIDNPAIPNEQNNHAIGLVTDSIFGGLQKMLGQGKLSEVMGMFAGKSAAQKSISGPIIDTLAQGLMTKFGLEAKSAQGISTSLIPGVLGKLAGKTNDSADTSFDMNGIIGSLIGGETSQGSPVSIPGIPSEQKGKSIDFNALLLSLGNTSLDKNRDGQLSMSDLSGLISGLHKDKTDQPNNGAGLLEMAGALFNG